MSTAPRSVQEMAHRLQSHACVRCGAAHGWYRPGCRYRCAGCGWRYRPDRLQRKLRSLRYFCLEISAHRVAKELGMSTPPIWQRFMAYRRCQRASNFPRVWASKIPQPSPVW